MSGASRQPPSSPHPPLALVAERLEAAVDHVGWGGPPLLVGVGEADPARVEPLPPVGRATDDPMADLLGYVVPADCSALGVVAEGTGRRLMGLEDRAGPTASYRLAYVLHRDGRAASAVRERGARVTVEEVEPGARGPGGRLVDVCHRALGRPTAPPPVDTTRLWLTTWLDLLLAESLGRHGPRSWPAAARRHPALLLVEAVDGPTAPPIEVAPDVLGRMGRTLGVAQGWDDLRRAAATGGWAVPGIIPEHAGWMDAGMFARWVLGEFLPLDVYLAELRDVLPPPVAVAVAEVAEVMDG